MQFPTLEVTDDDDAAFIDSVGAIVSGLAFRSRPSLLCIVRVRKWFDHRWLRMSGKGRVSFEHHPGVALDAMYQHHLTFPPFAPTRVASEQHWQRTAQGDYALHKPTFFVHSMQRRHSNTNLHRRVADAAASPLEQ
jgi:hypothetical protein